MLRAQSICQTCRGKGKLVKNKCGQCDNGSVKETAEINVHIPAGIISGKTLRLQGEGHRNAKGKGDLFIKIETGSDPRWKRDGANVFSTINVDFPTLVMGGKVEVETIWGKELVTIPEKTQAGAKLALANKGFPRLNHMLPTERGVHFVTASLKMPKGKLSKQQKELLQKYRECFE
jgi:molecular chaperone DnaJ